MAPRLHIPELKALFAPNPPQVSFEFFPPKTADSEEKLWATIKKLEPLKPNFVSVTYGAGGSTRERTHQTVKRILQQTGLRPAAHLTCVGASRNEIDEVVREYKEAGVRHIVALRGDPPEGTGCYTPHPEGYAFTCDLVEGIARQGDFEISVAAFPETHPEAVSPQDDIDNLKRKIDAGATRAITQYFFDIDVYMNFLERVRKQGIDVPIVPGILPVSSFAQVCKFSGFCGATVPKWMAELFAGLDDDPTTRNLVAAAVAAEQCRLLRTYGINEFHFYTLNRAELTVAICHILGIRQTRQDAADYRY